MPNPLTVLDTLGRPMRDLRISVTDRCNFRCVYCMPKEVFGRDHAFLPRAEILDFEEIERVVRASVALGVRKVRLTGGEPLVRRNLEALVAMLAAIDGIEDLTLTTNASLLADRAQGLADAGLHRVTVSLDALDDPTFQAMNDVGFPVSRVLEGIAAAEEAGLGPIKVNVVIRRGLNEHAIVDLAEHFRRTPTTVRYIEYMDVGHTNGWRLDDVVPAAEVVAAIDARWPLVPIESAYRGEVAQRYRYRDGARRDRRHQQRHPAVLRRLHPRAPHRRRPAVHLPLCNVGPRPARPHPIGRRRRRARGSAARHLGRPRRPLFRAPHARHGRPAEGGDELHRRVTTQPPARWFASGRIGQSLAELARCWDDRPSSALEPGCSWSAAGSISHSLADSPGNDQVWHHACGSLTAHTGRSHNMCLNCGCMRAHDDMGKPGVNITYEDVKAAADANGTTVEEALDTIARTADKDRGDHPQEYAG